MINLRYENKSVKLTISKKQNVTSTSAKRIIRTSRRLIKQNRAASMIVEVDNASWIDKSARELFDRVLSNSTKFPIIIISG